MILLVQLQNHPTITLHKIGCIDLGPAVLYRCVMFMVDLADLNILPCAHFSTSLHRLAHQLLVEHE